MANEDGGPAFPVPFVENEYGMAVDTDARGMTLRQWYVGQCIGEVVRVCRSAGVQTASEVAATAFEIADACIAFEKEDGDE